MRRTLLFVPADREKYIDHAGQVSELDTVILDIEDSVAEAQKAAARNAVPNAAAKLRACGKEVFIRINSPEQMNGILDILELVPISPDALVIPKASERSIILVDALLNAIEARQHTSHRIGLVPLIETSASIVNVCVILKASDRVKGVIFGAQDYMRNIGISGINDSEVCHYARGAVVNAAAACNVPAYDSPCITYQDQSICMLENQRARNTGFTGKTSIHPDALAGILQTFSPNEDDIQEAQKIIASYEAAQNNGLGSCGWNGRMIDLPVYEQAKRTLRVFQKGIEQ